MRLRTLILLELVAGAAIASAVALLAVIGLNEAQSFWTEPPSALASSIRTVPSSMQNVPRLQELPAPSAIVPEPAELPAVLEPEESSVVALPERQSTATMFDGIEDELLLSPLRNSPISKIKFNRGGSSISLRIDFENGSRAAFKPRQTNYQTIPRKEIAAYRINRLLGLTSVPPAIGRKFRLERVAYRDCPQ